LSGAEEFDYWVLDVADVVVAESGGVLSFAAVVEAWSSFAGWMMAPVGDSAELGAGSTITVRELSIAYGGYHSDNL
jgi:hypothetical protein